MIEPAFLRSVHSVLRLILIVLLIFFLIIIHLFILLFWLFFPAPVVTIVAPLALTRQWKIGGSLALAFSFRQGRRPERSDLDHQVSSDGS
jgi:hypothetical protein